MDYRATYFPDLDIPIYLNNAAISPLNTQAKAAATKLMDRFAATGVSAWVEGNAARERLRENLARLTGANAAEIGLVGNTSQGLLYVAMEYPWQAGDSLVLFRGEFPANILPWRIAAQRYDLQIHWLDTDDLIHETDAFKTVMAQKPTLLAISWVQYQTGQTVDMAQLSSLRERFGVHVAVDAIQGLGPLTLDLSQTPVDFFACGGHKWLLSPEGVGFLYVKAGHMEAFRPLHAGWLSIDEPVKFLFDGAGLVDYEAPFRKDVQRYEMGTMNSTGFAAMEASIALLLEIGPQTVSDHILALASACRNGLRELELAGVHPGANAGIASFKPAADTLRTLSRNLMVKGIVVATPDGYVRASPHLHNTSADIEHYLAALADWHAKA